MARRTKRPPTPRMHDLVAAIEEFTARRGYPPSLADCAARLKVCRGRAQAIANGARERGLVTWEPGRYRTIRAVDVRRQRARDD